MSESCPPKNSLPIALLFSRAADIPVFRLLAEPEHSRSGRSHWGDKTDLQSGEPGLRIPFLEFASISSSRRGRGAVTAKDLEFQGYLGSRPIAPAQQSQHPTRFIRFGTSDRPSELGARVK